MHMRRLGGEEPTSPLGCLTIMQVPKWQKGHGESVEVPPSQGGLSLQNKCCTIINHDLTFHIKYILPVVNGRLFFDMMLL